MKSIGILGSGAVGQALAEGLMKHGYGVMRGSREPEKLAAWLKGAGPRASTGTFADAARFGDAVVLAVKGTAAESALDLCEGALAKKLVMDTTNPIANAPPEGGVVRYFTGPNESLLERLQAKAPAAHFVKAFSCVGNAFMVDPDFGGIKPTMFICGNDASAKAQTAALLAEIGWEAEDMGGAVAARAIEPLCMLWCIPGLQHNRWTHAFKLLKK
jgi:8-hydroxy-5-deazaflavin:NADPH oxidoreductase